MIRYFLFLFFSILFSVAFAQGTFEKYDQDIPGSDQSIEMVPITGGAFNMGSPDSRNENEGPETSVLVDDFWMSSVEITWDQFELFLYREIDDQGTAGGDLEVEVDGVSAATMPYVNFNRPGHPLVNITQYAATTFCKWLTAKTGNYYRLPTEAEWEYACQAGENTPFSFGDNEDEIGFYAWHKGNSGGTFHKGNLKEPNAYGLYDMHGNVAEWVIDTYDEDIFDKWEDGVKNPYYYDEDALYPTVVKGGSWNQQPDELRCASRSFSDKRWKRRDPQFPKSLWWMTDATHVGFRIVRPKSVPSKEVMEKLWGKPINEY